MKALFTLIVAAALTTTSTLGQPCQPGWSVDFPGNDISGVVYCWGSFDDGAGPAVYVGGTFALGGGNPPYVNLARWTSSGWTPVAGPVTGAPQTGEVRALAVFDNGKGPALYVGGQIALAAGVPVGNLARWNGTTWSSAGNFNGVVHALTVFDDGTGPALYAAGEFTSVNGNAANRIARLTGSTWTALGSGTSAPVRALAASNFDGTNALYVGGDFTFAGGAPVDHLARWTGVTWQPVGGGLQGTGITIRALQTHDDGSGPSLFVGGNFEIPQLFGEPPIKAIARWDGFAYSPVGTGVGGTAVDAGVYSLSVLHTPSGAVLYAGGDFATSTPPLRDISGWNGSTWSSMDIGPQNNHKVMATAAINTGQGERLYVGGTFEAAGPYRAGSVCSWTGSSWAPLGNGLDHDVKSLLATQEGGEDVLYAGGYFTAAGTTLANRIARWNGSTWTALGSGVSVGGPNQVAVLDMVKFNDGSGESLFAGGSFTVAGGAAANNIAKWNGSAWAPLALGLNNSCLALAVYDDGTGPALFAGGTFTSAGSTSAANIARWNGATWTRLSNPGLNSVVTDMVAFDDGSGPALYVCGAFTSAGGAVAQKIARWRSGTWSTVGDGFNGDVLALAVHNDGFRPALYAGGGFFLSGTSPLSNIARWTGTNWSSVGTGIGGPVWTLADFDDGSGPGLYAGGNFGSAGAVTAGHIVKWNGLEYAALGTGATAPVGAIAAYQDTLFAGGTLLGMNGKSVGRLAAFHGCTPCYANCDGSTGTPNLTSNDFQCFLDRFASGHPQANCDGSTGTPALTSNDFQCFLNRFAAGCP